MHHKGFIPAAVERRRGCACQPLWVLCSPCTDWTTHHVLPCPPTRCSQIFPPCWHTGISPKKVDLGGGVGGESSLPKAKIPRGVLWNARSGSLLWDSVHWWTLGLGGPVSEFPGVPFICQVPSLVGTLLTTYLTLISPHDWYRSAIAGLCKNNAQIKNRKKSEIMNPIKWKSEFYIRKKSN